MRNLRELRLHVRAATLRTSIAKAKARLADAYYRAQDDAADIAHDDLTAAEWQLRAIERSLSR